MKNEDCGVSTIKIIRKGANFTSYSQDGKPPVEDNSPSQFVKLYNLTCRTGIICDEETRTNYLASCFKNNLNGKNVKFIENKNSVEEEIICGSSANQVLDESAIKLTNVSLGFVKKDGEKRRVDVEFKMQDGTIGKCFRFLNKVGPDSIFQFGDNFNNKNSVNLSNMEDLVINYCGYKSWSDLKDDVLVRKCFMGKSFKEEEKRAS